MNECRCCTRNILEKENHVGKDEEIGSLPIFESWLELINIEVTNEIVKNVQEGSQNLLYPLE